MKNNRHAPNKRQNGANTLDWQRTLYLVMISLGMATLLQPRLFGQWIQTKGPPGGLVNCLTVKGNNVFAGTVGGGIFRSTNYGNDWSSTNNGLITRYIYSIAIKDSLIFVGSPG